MADIEATEHKYSFKLKYTTRNYGTTPAVGVYIHPQHVLFTPGFDLDGTQRKICELGMNPAVFSMGGHDLFPTQVNETPYVFEISKKYVDISNEAFREFSVEDAIITSFNPFIFGCVTYRSTFDNTIHRTPFSFQLVRKDPKIVGNFLSFNTSLGTIPMQSIYVQPFISIGGIRPD
jgi:hypothetical protein